MLNEIDNFQGKYRLPILIQVRKLKTNFYERKFLKKYTTKRHDSDGFKGNSTKSSKTHIVLMPYKLSPSTQKEKFPILFMKQV